MWFLGVMSRNKTMLSKNMITSKTGSIRDRGSDDSGFWSNETTSISLGHRRLSIADLSSTGHQPMHSPSNRNVLDSNGEIYNHLEIGVR